MQLVAKFAIDLKAVLLILYAAYVKVDNASLALVATLDTAYKPFINPSASAFASLLIAENTAEPIFLK